jgi:hypothetical protein
MSKIKVTPEVVEKIKKLGIMPEIEFYFVPSTDLKNRIIRGGDLIIDQLPKLAKEVILNLPSGQGISVYSPMVMKYIEGTLDVKNSYIFDLGEIRIQNYGEIVLKCLNRSKQMAE